MVRYAEFHGLEDDVAVAFVYVIQAMDAVYLEWEQEEQARRRKEAQK